MTWLKKDDRFPEHRKVRRLSDGAYRLHDTALCACARDETDGLLTESDLDDLQHSGRLRKYAPELVKAGLWEPVEGGWMMHDYLDYNPSHAHLEVERERSRERQRRARERRLGINPDEIPSDEDVSRRDSRVSHGGVTRESRCPDPTRPDPARTTSNDVVPTPIGVGGAQRQGGPKRGTRLPADFVPSEVARKTIIAESPDLDLRREHARFVDHWTAQPGQRGVKADWDATWRNWMRRSADELRRRGRTRQQETDDLFAAALARAEAADAAEAATIPGRIA